MRRIQSDRLASGVQKRMGTERREAFHPVFTFHDAVWAVEDQLLMDDEGRLLLSTGEDTQNGGSGRLRLVTLKESVRWLRTNRLYAKKWTEGEAYGDWLQMIEEALD